MDSIGTKYSKSIDKCDYDEFLNDIYSKQINRLKNTTMGQELEPKDSTRFGTPKDTNES